MAADGASVLAVVRTLRGRAVAATRTPHLGIHGVVPAVPTPPPEVPLTVRLRVVAVQTLPRARVDGREGASRALPTGGLPPPSPSHLHGADTETEVPVPWRVLHGVDVRRRPDEARVETARPLDYSLGALESTRGLL